MAAEDLWHSRPCHSRSLSHERSKDRLFFSSIQLHLIWNDPSHSSPLKLFQLSLSWSNSQLVRFPRPTPRRWLLKSGGDPVQLSTNNWTPSFPPLRSFGSAATSELYHHERRDVFLLSKNKHTTATKSQGKGQMAFKDWKRKRVNLYL